MIKPFKIKLSAGSPTKTQDCESLFRDLKNRDPKIQHLWSHQADVLRSYHTNITQKDIAFELPTGTGKTLVGLLVAEWRRSNLNERVVYLCPTRQLAKQVGAQANEYGVKAHVFIGPQNRYDRRAFSEYSEAKAIAITTYSAIFNIRPRIRNPQIIILDDAHAADNYIAGMWSMSITRSKHKELYSKLIELFRNELPSFRANTFLEDDADPYLKAHVELLPSPKFLSKKRELIGLCGALIKDKSDTSYYVWKLIRGKLDACMAFISWSEFFIRPWLPPALTHKPFADAKQRIYMSATFGAGGELERISGVPSIHRIAAPKGWDKQSTGRRLFIFPDRSFAPEEYTPWLNNFIASQERILVIAPNTLTLTSFKESACGAGVKHNILHSQDIEESLEAFTKTSKTILALTNRYDGLDLPGEACRILVVYHLPSSVNLMEKFLWSQLGLKIVLRDIVQTRITQATGRCTRNSSDYAIVIMTGQSLFEFCVNRETLEEFHPELRAEIDFGIDNSNLDNISHFDELIKIFLARGPEWEKIDRDIIKRRDEKPSVEKPYIDTLRTVSALEVKYQYDLWKEDYKSALDNATQIIDKLSGDELAGYRALWNYFAGCAAHQASVFYKDVKMMPVAVDRFKRASKSSGAVTWFSKLSHEVAVKTPPEIIDLPLANLASELIDNYIVGLGTVGKAFDKKISKASGDIKSDDFNKFDTALTELGKMLGFVSHRPEGSGVPDSVWVLSDCLALVFECKSDETAKDNISIRTCRQAQGHREWFKAKLPYVKNKQPNVIIVSPRKFLDKDAVPHAKGLFYIDISDVRALFGETESFLRTVRSKSQGISSVQRRDIIQSSLTSANLKPEQIIERLTKIKLLELDTR